MNKFVTLLLFFNLVILSTVVQARTTVPLQDCDQITQISLEKLVIMVDKNDFSNLESVLGTIESSCGQSEFTQRLRILRALIEKISAGALIADYLSKNYQESLVMRWDYSVEPEYRSIYKNNKSDFNHVPLNHPIDSLVKLKSAALLNSTAYNLTDQERKIALLFSDNIEAFYQSYHTETPRSTTLNKPKEHKTYKERGGLIIYGGIEFPITGKDPLFKTNPTFSFMYSSKLSSQFLYELGVKFRVNSNDRAFDYVLYDEVQTVNSTVSLGFGGNLGYKIFDNDKFIIAPKIGLYYETTNTGLSEVTDSYYYDDYYYDDYDQGTSSIRYHNVNTMRTTLGVSFMRHLAKKKYIGVEGAYHYIPYDWDKNLLTSIQPNYASLQMFLRF
ncbi:hypothetical protein HP439_00150 [Sphingobacterium shayense]|uniref:hypothetical protein n=1 Tax=Sphingobacterium shayense TaxID=626343 RepID=UPI001555460F|nr:hypothetical protein [Sphingobacterium shayense]NQD69130.1 hypothetical protein [Sphingobacterium shayense]